MNILPTFSFNYAIRFPDGLYFQGPVYQTTDADGKPIPVKKQPRVYDPKHRGPKNTAYTYTESRAHIVIMQNQIPFSGCVVERVL